MTIGTAQDVARRSKRIRLLDLDGVRASVANVANETYPLRRPLNVVTNGPAEGIVKDFLAYLKAEQGQKIVASLEFIPVDRSMSAKPPAK